MPVLAKPEWFLPPHMCQPDRSAAMRKMMMMMTTWMAWTLSPKNPMVAHTDFYFNLLDAGFFFKNISISRLPISNFQFESSLR